MVTTFIEFSDQLVIIKDNQNAQQEMAAIQITISSQLKHNFHKEIKKFPKILMLEDGAKFFRIPILFP